MDLKDVWLLLPDFARESIEAQKEVVGGIVGERRTADPSDRRVVKGGCWVGAGSNDTLTVAERLKRVPFRSEVLAHAAATVGEKFRDIEGGGHQDSFPQVETFIRGPPTAE
jgi:hypothetical protein